MLTLITNKFFIVYFIVLGLLKTSRILFLIEQYQNLKQILKKYIQKWKKQT